MLVAKDAVRKCDKIVVGRGNGPHVHVQHEEVGGEGVLDGNVAKTVDGVDTFRIVTTDAAIGQTIFFTVDHG